MSRTSKQLLKTLTASFLILSAATVSAKQITVTEVGGQGMSVTGELLSFDGDAYTVRTTLGDLKLDVLGSICAGNACPSFVEESSSVTLADNLAGGAQERVNQSN